MLMKNSSVKDATDVQNKEASECRTQGNDIISLEGIPENTTLHASFMDDEISFEPYVGMEYDSLDVVEIFYKSFAKEKGFGIRIRSSKTGARCDEVVSRIYVCCNEGYRKVKTCKNVGSEIDEGKSRKNCSTLRTGCGAMLKVSRAKSSKNWVVKSFNNDHNHVMVSPKSVSYLRCHKKMSIAAKSLVEKFNEEGMPTGKVAALFSSGNQQFSERDCWNHLRDLRRKNLDVGDAQAVLSYCRKKQAENPNFFYAIQCDGDTRMVIFFWVDARSRLAYQYFGDVVTFDTTYKTNKYSMPFAPFTGSNHHHQSILFGCALLQDESEHSFIWLFETWLEAMYRKQPISLITDQDLAIGAAVAKVFPITRHRLCLWHIKKKFPEKLSHIYKKNSSFKRDLKRCIRESPTVEEFENDWPHLMVTYGLEGNEWLQGLYKIRESWIPVYNRSTFFAGMNTTQRSESINAFFDSFVNSATTLREFVTKYEKAVDSRFEKERREDFESRHKSRILRIGSKIEHHAASVYTRNIFNMFQNELVKSNHFTKERIEKSGTYYKYKVSNCFDSRDQFIVCLDVESKIGKCECQLFEFLGILCRHLLAIFQFKNVIEIPNHFIMNRWTKEANSGIKISKSEFSCEATHMSGALRSMHVCRHINYLSSLAERSEKIYKVIVTNLDQCYKKASMMEIQMLASEEKDNMNQDQQLIGEEMEELIEERPIYPHASLNIGDPHISQTKGRKKDNEKEKGSGRIKSGLEISLAHATVKRRACQLCGGYGHNRRSCKQIIDAENSDQFDNNMAIIGPDAK